MTGTEIAIVIGAVVTACGALATAIRAASTSYREAVDRRAAEIEHKRLADQAVATVKAKDEEIEELKTEIEWLRARIPQGIPK